MIFVFLPGLDGTGDLFEPLFNSLPPKTAAQVISYPPEQCLGYAELEEYVRKRLPEKDEFTLIAESFSGPVACQIALKPPANLKKIVFVATFIKNPRPFLLKAASFLPLSLFFRFRVPAWAARRWLFEKETPAGLILQFKKSLQKVKPAVLAFRVRQVAQVTPPQQKISLPAVYLQAKKDKMVLASRARPFQNVLETLTLVQLPGPHLLLQTRPQECIRVILKT